MSLFTRVEECYICKRSKSTCFFTLFLLPIHYYIILYTMLKFASLILGVFFSAVVSAVANENVQILAEESISIIPGPDGRNVIPVVQTIDGTITTFYYTIIGEQTIVNGEQSTTLDGGKSLKLDAKGGAGQLT